MKEGQLPDFAFNHLAEYYFGLMYPWFVGYARNSFKVYSEDLIDDIYLHVMEKMWLKMREGQPIRSFIAYFRTSAYHELVNFKRQRSELELMIENHDVNELSEDHIDYAILFSQILQSVKPFIKEKEYRIFELYLNFHTYEQIELSIPCDFDKVKNTINKVKNILRKHFELIDNQLVKKKSATH